MITLIIALPMSAHRSLYSWRVMALLWVGLGLGLANPMALRGQTTAAVVPSPKAQVLLPCPSRANPRNLSSECGAQPLDSFDETLTKDWAGIRSKLSELGVTPTASYTTQLMGNITGGQSRGFTYSGTLELSLVWDLEKLLRLPGLSFHLSGAWSTGRNLSAAYIGNSFTVQDAYTAPGGGANNLTLGEMYFQQQLFNGSLTLAGGRLAADDTFATMPVVGNYANAGIDAIPGALGLNDVAFTAYPPGVEWGARALYRITPQFELALGFFNTNRSSALGGQGGLNFTLQQGNRGVLSVFQVNYLVNQGGEETGLPGQYSIGGFYDSNRFASLRDPGADKSGNYSIYALFQQMVYRDGPASSQRGLTVWAETVMAPKQSINVMPFFLGGGLSYQGLIPRRGDDIASAGVIHGWFSRYLAGATAETVLEANYQIKINSWFSIMPDLQYVIRPNGNSRIGNAWVLGTQMEIVF